MSLRQVGEKSVMYFKETDKKLPPKMKKKKSKKDTFDVSEETQESLPKKYDMWKRLNRYDACFRLSAAGGVSSPLSIGWYAF